MSKSKTKSIGIAVTLPSDLVGIISREKITEKVRHIFEDVIEQHIETALEKICNEVTKKQVSDLTQSLRPMVEKILRKEIERQAAEIVKDMVTNFRLSYEY